MKNRCHQSFLSVLLACLFSLPVLASPPDPLESPMWDYLRNIFLTDQSYQFDGRVKVSVPPFAEDPTQVPVLVDASSITEPIEKIVVWADFNPIQHIYTYYPLKEIRNRLSLRIKVQQATPVRAAVKLHTGNWLVGGAWIDAEGGGCTAPSLANASPYWESHLGEISGRKFIRSDGGRFKFKVIHPMDTGLVSSIPEFYLEQLELRTGSGDVLARMELSQPVSENPVFTFDVLDQSRSHTVWLRDNNGNEFEQELR